MAASLFYSEIEACLLGEHDFKDQIRGFTKNLDSLYRKLEVIIQGMHRNKSARTVCEEGRCVLDEVKTCFGKLAELLDGKHYYQYLSLWQTVTGKLAFVACLIVYLESKSLAGIGIVAQMLGVKSDAEDGFHICLDEYLCGLLQLASELSRWAVNCVTIGNTTEPHRIFEFVGKIDSGFRLLNLKNDFLRKRYDGLKYDMKKIEQVVYDLQIRGFNKEATNTD